MLAPKIQMGKNPQNLEWNPRNQNSRTTLENLWKKEERMEIKAIETYQGSMVEEMED